MQPYGKVSTATIARVLSEMGLPQAKLPSALTMSLNDQKMTIDFDPNLTFLTLEKKLLQNASKELGVLPVGQFKFGGNTYSPDTLVHDCFVDFSRSIEICWEETTAWKVQQYLKKKTGYEWTLEQDKEGIVISLEVKSQSKDQVPKYTEELVDKAPYIRGCVTSVLRPIVEQNILGIAMNWLLGRQFHDLPSALHKFVYTQKYKGTVGICLGNILKVEFRMSLDQLALILRHAQQQLALVLRHPQQQQSEELIPHLGSLPDELLQNIVGFMAPQDTEQVLKLFSESLKKARFHPSVTRKMV